MNNVKLSYLGLVVSVVLLILKAWAAALSGSVAIISDALNSFLDLFSYGVIAASVRVQHKQPDKGHQFGYYRAEPLAGFIVAVMAVLLGFSVVKDAASSLFQGDAPRVSGIPLLVLGISVTVKLIMSRLYSTAGRVTSSAAMTAASVDSRNDVAASLTALVGFALKGAWDGLAGVVIGLWILYSGIRMGIENSGYLLGTSPSETFSKSIRQVALSVPGVSAVNDIRSHYVGSLVHLEVHIEVPADMPIGQAHDIGESVRQMLQERDGMGAVFVHIDPLGDPIRLPYAH